MRTWSLLLIGVVCASTAFAAGPEEKAELEAFVDGLMAAYLEAFHTAGSTVSVVKDGELFFAKGYGDADVEAKKEVDAATTLFRIGSVSKLFVWTAVMQQVEQGKIDLDADVNEYLTEIEIPATFADAVTMKSLMAHAPGFEDSVIGLFAKSPNKVEPLVDILKRDMPKRVRPPMVETSYSNHGTALAAHIVENVTGTPWDEYVERHIFAPLNMAHTTFRQPVPPAIAKHLSKGYGWSGGKFVEKDFEYVPIAPAGSVSASATDMASFMIAHLQDGRFKDTQILRPETARLMHSELFQQAEGINAMAYGFYEMNRNGERIVGHGGDTLYFHSELALFLDRNLGYFVSFNSAEGGRARTAFAEAFTDHYFPVDDAKPLSPPAEVVANLDRYTGTYRVNRFSYTSLAKLAALMQTVTIAEDDGALTVSMMPGKRWIPIDALLFREEDGYDTLAFRENAHGEITHAFPGNVPVVALDKMTEWYQEPLVHALVALGTIVIYLLTLFRWPVSTFLHWRYGVEERPSEVLPRSSRVVLWLGALVFLAFPIGIVASMPNGPDQIVFGVPTLMQAALVLPMIGAVLAVVALICAVRAWALGQGRFFARVRYTIVTLAFFVTLVQLAYWNLLGFRF